MALMDTRTNAQAIVENAQAIAELMFPLRGRRRGPQIVTDKAPPVLTQDTTPPQWDGGNLMKRDGSFARGSTMDFSRANGDRPHTIAVQPGEETKV